jgi:hypothetical protein
MKFRLKADATFEAANITAALYVISGYFNHVAHLNVGESIREPVLNGELSVKPEPHE